jgi:uncharacterized protein YneR
MKQMKHKTSKNEHQIYSCKICHYACSNKYNLKRHFSTTKHKMKQNETQNENKTSDTIFCCETCSKNFKSRTTLWRHKKNCCYSEIKSEESLVKIEKNQKDDLMSTLILQLAEAQTKNQEITNELVKQNQKILEHIIKTPSNITNTNCNNKMTINMYLNKECKDAMNLTDFVENVQISLEDLKYTTEYGYVKGISNIFAKQLQDMKPTERPIHCSDKKRMQFYIKEEDKWEKDTKHSKIDQSIAEVMLKQIKKIRHWEDDHPNFMHDEKLRNTWNKMIQQTLGGASDDEMKKNKMDIKKEVSKIIEVKDGMIE